jgi:hypothetical protein
MNLKKILQSRGAAAMTAAGAAAMAGEACETSPSGPSGSSVTGTWIGSVSHGSDKVGVRYNITDDSGTLGGGGSFADPKTGSFWQLASVLTGDRIDNRGSWTTGTGLVVSGTFQGGSFGGTAKFPANPKYGSLTADIQLTWHPLEPSPTPTTAAAAGSVVFLAGTAGIGAMMPVRPCGAPRPAADTPD